MNIYFYVRIDRLSMFINQIYALKQASLFQSVLTIIHFDSCFLSKILKNKLEAQSTRAEQLHSETVFAQLFLLVKTSQRLLLNTVWEGYISNNIQILVIISTYGTQSSSQEADSTSESTKSKKMLLIITFTVSVWSPYKYESISSFLSVKMEFLFS